MKSESIWFYSPYKKDYIQNEKSIIEHSKLDEAIYLKENYSHFLDDFRFLWDEFNSNYFGNYDKFDEVQYPKGSWKKLLFKVWGLKRYKNINKFNSIKNLLSHYPRITSCFIARLAPNSKVLTHSGETDAIIRIHLGLKIPECGQNICSIKIGEDIMDWQNGGVFAFNDACEHEAWNNTNEFRYILVVDVLKNKIENQLNSVNIRMGSIP